MPNCYPKNNWLDFSLQNSLYQSRAPISFRHKLIRASITSRRSKFQLFFNHFFHSLCHGTFFSAQQLIINCVVSAHTNSGHNFIYLIIPIIQLFFSFRFKKKKRELLSYPFGRFDYVYFFFTLKLRTQAKALL